MNVDVSVSRGAASWRAQRPLYRRTRLVGASHGCVVWGGGGGGGVVMRGRRGDGEARRQPGGNDKTVSLQGSSRLGYWADDVVFSDGC